MPSLEIVKFFGSIKTLNYIGKADNGVFGNHGHEVLVKFKEEKELEVNNKIFPRSWNAA